MKDKKKLITYLGAIGLFLIVGGISYALFTANFIGDKTQEIVIGEDFIFSYNETSNGLSLTEEDILIDDIGSTSSKYFDFNVKLQTQYEKTVDYYIYLTKDATSTLDERYIKVYLTDQNDTVLKTLTTISSLKDHKIYNNSKYLYGNSITSNNNTEEVHNYRLRVWVSDSYNTGYQTNEPGDGTHTSTTSEKTYKFTVNIATGEMPLEGNLASYWKDKTENETSYLALYTLDTVTLPETYEYGEETYTLETSIDVSKQENGSVILGEYKSGENMIAVIGQDGKVVAPQSSSNLFSLYYIDSSSSETVSNLQLIDLSNFDTSQATSMGQMFAECRNLTSIIGLNNFDTSNVTNMMWMFQYCYNLTSLDVTSFDTRNVTNMSSMFQDCQGLQTLNISNFNTSNVTNMSSMFNRCVKLANLDLSNFDTSNVTNMAYMFLSCQGLTELDLTSFDTSKVTDMTSMFRFSSNLTSITVGCNFVIGESTTTTNMYQDAGVSSVTKVCNE